MNKHEVVVVGGGLAGLTAALSLAHGGTDVLLIEKNEHCGGLMNTFWRDGFRFEGGARALVNAGLVTPLMKEFGLELDILPNPITLGIEDKLLVINGERSLHEYAQILKGLYKGIEHEVDGIIGAIRSVINDMKVLYGVDNPLFTKKKNNPLVLAPSMIAWTFKFFRTMIRISRMNTPFEQALDKLSNNQALKDIIGQHFFRNTPVFFALSYFALYNDYVYPKGGVGAFINALTDAITQRGGKIRCKTEVIRVEPEKKILTDDSGQEYRYNSMIWAGDLRNLYQITEGTVLTGNIKHQFLQQKDRVLAQKGAESVFSVFAAVDLPPEVFSAIATGHMFYTPDRAGLGELHTRRLKELLDRWDLVTRDELNSWLKDFCQYNTFEVSIPVLRDSEAAPQGQTGFIISALFDYELTERIREAGWYDEFKKQVELEFIAVLSRSIYPGLQDKILFSFSASPRSIFDMVKSAEGSIVGWSFEAEIPAVTSMFRMADSVKTVLPGVYTAGKWVYSPAGGPTAIMTGRIAAKRCQKELKKYKVL